MGILAGIVLIVFGALHFRKKENPNQNATFEIKEPSTLSMIVKGFFLNSLNPAVWLLWLSNVSGIGKLLEFSVFKMILYFSITLGLVLLVELAKVSASNRLKRILNVRIMHAINIVTGTLLVIFGLVLIYNHFFE